MVSPNVSVALSNPSVTVAVAVVVPEPAVVKLKGFDTALWLRSVNVHVTLELVPDVVGAAQVPSGDVPVNVKNALS
jgi:hypothetical protein